MPKSQLTKYLYTKGPHIVITSRFISFLKKALPVTKFPLVGKVIAVKVSSRVYNG